MSEALPVHPPPDPISVPAPAPAAERLLGLDAVRGLAVLGILVMNVVEFGLPLRAYGNPAGGGGTAGADLWSWLVQVSFFDGKMRALFSMLFGAGIVLLATRMESTGRGATATDLLLRRCLWLVPFGIAHRFLLQFTGDILYMYGLFGLIAIAFRRARARTLIALGLCCLSAFVPIEAWHYRRAAELRSQAREAVALRAASQEPTPELAQAQARWERRLAPPDDAAIAPELEAMRGGWPAVFAYRWGYHHDFQSAYLYYYFVWDVLGMMLLGMGLQKLGFFAGTMPVRTYLGFLAAGAAAVAVCFALAWAWRSSGYSAGAIELRAWREGSYAYTRGLAGLGWASALILALRAGRARALGAALAAVGRMAFSNYVLQTVLCTLLFFGYGFGLYGSLSRFDLMLVWLGVSAAQLAFSLAWLRSFRFGPLEWAWRSLTYGRRQPLRLATAAA